MSLLEDAYKSYKGLIGYQEPTSPQVDYATLYAQRSGVMDASVQYPVDVHHKGLSETFGENIHQTPRLLGTPSTWEEFGDQTTKSFEELGLQVDKTRLFPVPAHLSASEGRDIPDGTVAEGKDFNEMNWLKNDADSNLDPRQNPTQGWALDPDPNSTRHGLLTNVGLMRPSLQSVNPTHTIGDNNYLGISRQGALLSRPTPSTPDTPDTTETFAGGAPDFKSYDVTTKGTKGTASIPAQQNVTGHEYGHYLDVWMGGANNDTTLSQIALSLRSPNVFSASDLYEAWMNDPRTAHLDVVDNINTVQQGAKVNNPRETLGKLYVSAMINPIQDSDGNDWSMEENIARALGVFFNPDQRRSEGHSQEIKDMRGDVMASLANLLNQ